MQELKETFHVELPLATAWERLRLADAEGHGDRCRIPGFPSFDGKGGCAAKVVQREPQRRLLAVKEDAPCAGSQIAIDIAPANAAGWPTRVTVSQSNLPSEMAAMPDEVAAHWRIIVADFRLYLEREAIAPTMAWAGDLGAATEQTPLGLVLSAVRKDRFADRCGMSEGDLLLTLGGARIRIVEALWAALAAATPGRNLSATWARGSTVQAGTARR